MKNKRFLMILKILCIIIIIAVALPLLELFFDFDLPFIETKKAFIMYNIDMGSKNYRVFLAVAGPCTIGIMRYFIQKLNEKIELMQSGSENADNHSERRNALDLQMELRLKEVKDRLEKLKWRNNALTEENELLRGRLQKAEAKLNESISKLELTDQLEIELTIQKNKVEELSESLRRLREPPSSNEEPTVPLAPKNPTPGTQPEPVTLTPPAIPPTPVQEMKTTPVMTPSSSAKEKRSTTPHRPILGFLGRRRKDNQDSPPEVTKS